MYFSDFSEYSIHSRKQELQKYAYLVILYENNKFINSQYENDYKEVIKILF
jgi:hypothetical protein